MYIVYIIRSLQRPSKHYVGFTTNLEKRLKTHNAGKSPFSRKYAPRELETYIVFKQELPARRFGKYLKQGSGHFFSGNT